MRFFQMLGISLLACFALAGRCSSSEPTEPFTILSGSENEDLVPLVEAFAEKNDIKVKFVFDGSVNIMRSLQKPGAKDYDAVWPASSLWINLGDSVKVVQSSVSAYVSPVVLGITPKAQSRLGWSNEITVAELMAAIEKKSITFAMTSATQSNSGAAAYLAFVQAMSQKTVPFSSEDLQNSLIQSRLRTLLAAVNRSSGSSGWLKSLAIQQNLEAMINYESQILEANRELIQNNREPYHIVYLKDATGVADSPLGLVAKDPKKKAFFLALQTYLASPEGQQQLLQKGRRTPTALFTENYPPEIFRTDWGVAPKRIFAAQTLPGNEVILEAFKIYQEQLRKPSLTAYCLDYSGSMEGKPIQQLKDAMQLILSPASSDYLIQASKRDRSLVFRFDSHPKFLGEARGVDAQDLIQTIDQEKADGGTDIYACIEAAISKIAELEKAKPFLKDFNPALVVMTDGKSKGGESFQYSQINKLNISLPIFSIMFGEADRDQVQNIANQSSGRVFDGTLNLSQAFVSVKGYN